MPLLAAGDAPNAAFSGRACFRFVGKWGKCVQDTRGDAAGVVVFPPKKRPATHTKHRNAVDQRHPPRKGAGGRDFPFFTAAPEINEGGEYLRNGAPSIAFFGAHWCVRQPRAYGREYFLSRLPGWSTPACPDAIDTYFFCKYLLAEASGL